MKLLKKFVIKHQIEYLSSTNKMYLSSLVFCVLHVAGMKQNSNNKQLTINTEGSVACGEK